MCILDLFATNIQKPTIDKTNSLCFWNWNLILEQDNNNFVSKQHIMQSQQMSTMASNLDEIMKIFKF
jgi:hypothetical protein